MSDIQVTMLGGFSIERNGSRVDDSSNRMRKVWLLLAYLIYSRNTGTSQESIRSLLQGGGSDDSADSNGRIKGIFYRVRTMLDQLGASAGHELVLHKGGSYTWNNRIPLQLDVEEFEALCTAAANEPDEQARLAVYQQALALYKGDFLPKLSMEPWVMPISTYYHQMYLSAVEQTLELLEKAERWADSMALCRQALKIEAYSETVCQYLMRSQIALGDGAAALQTYEEMSELLFSTFGVMPSDESRRLYRLATREGGSGAAVPAGTVRDQLREPEGTAGAMFCEYDFFRLLYQVQARAIVRSGEVIHIALLSLHPYGRKELSRKSLDTAMDNLQELLIRSLRRGDIVTKCSISQLIIMLPQANYENSCAVCQRILKAFNRQYPHSPAEIHYSVQPLEPLAPPSAPETVR